MTRATYLTAGLALAVLLLAGIGTAFAYAQMGSMMDDQGTSEDQADGNGMGSGMTGGDGGSMMGGSGMGS